MMTGHLETVSSRSYIKLLAWFLHLNVIDLDARPWDFQAEECALRTSVDRFNNRRYTNKLKDADFEPVDNCLSSVLGSRHELSDSFKKHYAQWLEEEVFNVTIEWEKLLININNV